MMKRYALSAILVLLFALRLSAQNTAIQTFDVRKYGAKGDGTTDDTTAIGAAVTAAQAFTAANTINTATVIVPRGTYIVAGATGSGAVNITGDRVTLTGEGTLKLANGDDADAVLRIVGDYNTVEGITLDGNAAGTPTGRNECLRIQAVALTGDGTFNTIKGVTAQNTSSSSSNGNTFIVTDNCTNNTFVDCTSLESGENGIRIGGDYTTIINFRAIGFNKKGLTVNSDEDLHVLTVHGYYAESDTTNAGANGFQVDIGPGGSTEPDDGASIDQVWVRDAVVNMTGASGFGAGSKFVRIHNLSIDGFNVRTPNRNVPAITFAEGLGNVSIKNAFLQRGIDQDTTPYDPTGTLTAVANNGSGFARFTCVGHDVRRGDYIVIAGTSNYSGVHLVTNSYASEFDTNQKYVAEAFGGDEIFYNCIGRLSLENVVMGDRSDTVVNMLGDLQVYELFCEKCQFIWYTLRGIGLKDDNLPLSLVGTIDARNSYFESNGSSANYCIRKESVGGAEWGTTSRKMVWLNNGYEAVGSNNGNTANTADMRVMQTADSTRRVYITSALTGTEVTWQVGDIFYKPSTTVGQSPGWVCTTAGTFSSGTFATLPPLRDGILTSNVTEVGNVGSGEDNLITYTLPANSLNTSGQSLEIEAGFTFAANANTKTIKLYLGSTDLMSLSGAAQNAGSYRVHVVAIRDASNIAKVSVVGGTYGGSGTPLGNIPGNVFNHTADMTGALTIKGTGTATSDNDVVMEYLRVRLLPEP